MLRAFVVTTATRTVHRTRQIHVHRILNWLPVLQLIQLFQLSEVRFGQREHRIHCIRQHPEHAPASSGVSTDGAGSLQSISSVCVFTAGSFEDPWPCTVQFSSHCHLNALFQTRTTCMTDSGEVSSQAPANASASRRPPYLRRTVLYLATDAQLPA